MFTTDEDRIGMASMAGAVVCGPIGYVLFLYSGFSWRDAIGPAIGAAAGGAAIAGVGVAIWVLAVATLKALLGKPLDD